MHACFSEYVRKIYAHPSVLHIQQSVFVLISYQDIKGLEAFLGHEVMCHECTMGTGYIYIGHIVFMMC